jgi:hypothetical protein
MFVTEKIGSRWKQHDFAANDSIPNIHCKPITRSDLQSIKRGRHLQRRCLRPRGHGIGRSLSTVFYMDITIQPFRSLGPSARVSMCSRDWPFQAQHPRHTRTPRRPICCRSPCDIHIVYRRMAAEHAATVLFAFYIVHMFDCSPQPDVTPTCPSRAHVQTMFRPMVCRVRIQPSGWLHPSRRRLFRLSRFVMQVSF